MREHVYELTSDGFINEHYLATCDDNGDIVSYTNKYGNEVVVDKEFITIHPPIEFQRPKWTGTEWVEGESEEEKTERESQQLLESLNPTEQELLKAERELETIDLLLEMGLI